ncbi:MAG: pectin esterase [Clostridia bacterium]|nr:pectin esterase [Clostridia bacterium]
MIFLTPSDDLQKAFNGLKSGETVHLKKGEYRQKAVLAADNVTLIGEGCGQTVITFDDYARKIHADGKEYNTFRTYTLCVTGNGVRLENLTVKNSNSMPEEVGQCVALSVHGKNFKARDCEFISTQDTLFLSPFPDDLVVRYRGFIPEKQLYCEGANVGLFENCRISGNVDFIFGCGEGYFKNCEIVSLPDRRGVGFVCAPAHSLAQENGFTFLNCNFSNGGAKENSCYLARPWRDFGKCAFVNCTLGDHVKGELFDKWNDTSRDKTARFLYYGLKSVQPLSPVSWAKETDGAQAKSIIENLEKKFLSF